MKKSFLFFLATFLMLSYSIPSVIAADEFASYTSPEGIKFKTQSQNWDEESLKKLYSFLLRNKLGEEFKSLKDVTVMKDACSANNIQDEGEVGIAGLYIYPGSIQLCYGDSRVLTSDDKFSIELVLSHEYGHHFTYYHMLNKKLRPSHISSSSEWAKVRQIDYLPTVGWNGKRVDHDWRPEEIMAEDYVMLYGAPQIKMKYGIREDNPKITNAAYIPELAKYWEDISGVKSNVLLTVERPQLTSFTVFRDMKVNVNFYGLEEYTFTYTPPLGAEAESFKYFVQISPYYGGAYKGGNTTKSYLYPYGLPIKFGSQYINWDEDKKHLEFTADNSTGYLQASIVIVGINETTGTFISSPPYYYNFKDLGDPRAYNHSWKDMALIIDNIEQTYFATPIIKDGITLVPLRYLFEKFNAAVTWDNETKTAKVTKDNTNLVLTINSNVVTVNGKATQLEVPPQLIDNKTMVPLRFISEQLGAEVTWDEAEKSVLIKTRQ